MEINKIYNMDCLEGMKQMADNSVDLIVTDPPYGFLNGVSQFGGATPYSKNEKGKPIKPTSFNPIDWDNKPDEKMMQHIFRISKNQIIFGFEHLSHILPQSRGVYCWDKKRPEGTSFSEFELIWTSFDQRAKFIRFLWNGMMRDSEEVEKHKTLHPTQKPLEVVKKLIINHSKEGDLICDPFMGSGTTAVACKQLNRNFIGFELSKEYCDIARERLQQNNLMSWF